jgi:CheY-like chemotaxis protein
MSRAPILVVEDDAEDVFFMLRAFEKAGVKPPVRVAKDGLEAIEYLAGSGPFQDRGRFPLPCLVVLDLKLPKKNGLEVLQWLRRRENLREMPVVMVSGAGQASEKDQVRREGVDLFLVKPITFDELVELAAAIRVEAEEHCEGE